MCQVTITISKGEPSLIVEVEEDDNNQECPPMNSKHRKENCIRVTLSKTKPDACHYVLKKLLCKIIKGGSIITEYCIETERQGREVVT